MADGDPKTPPAPLPKKDERKTSRSPQNSAAYSEGPNIATLFSQPQKRPHDHQNRQAFYTGGSEHSGQQVLGPSNNDQSSQSKKVKKMFKRMIEMMRQHQEEDEDDEGASSSHFAPFTGNGFTLGTEETNSQRVDGPNITPTAKTEHEASNQYPAFAGSGFTLGTTENDSQLVKGLNDENDAIEETGDDDDDNSPVFSSDSAFFGRGFCLGTADDDPQSVDDESENVLENSAENDAGDNAEDSPPVIERPFPGVGFTLSLGETDNDSKPVQGLPVFRVSDESPLSYFEQFSSFVGAGYTLGTTEDDSQRVDGPSTSKKAKVASSVLRIWSNGITIDDGPLYAFNDPQTMKLYDAFQRNSKKGRIEDRHFEKYQVQQATFSGEGNRLKGAESANQQPTSITTATLSTSPSGDPALNRAKALSAAMSFLSFDQSQPGTRIQIRLADGSRIVVQINTSRLVSDLRQYIIIAHPEYSETEFQLMNTFPNKVIDQESVTIEQSGLANSTLVQHLI